MSSGTSSGDGNEFLDVQFDAIWARFKPTDWPQLPEDLNNPAFPALSLFLDGGLPVVSPPLLPSAPGIIPEALESTTVLELTPKASFPLKVNKKRKLSVDPVAPLSTPFQWKPPVTQSAERIALANPLPATSSAPAPPNQPRPSPWNQNPLKVLLKLCTDRAQIIRDMATLGQEPLTPTLADLLTRPGVGSQAEYRRRIQVYRREIYHHENFVLTDPKLQYNEQKRTDVKTRLKYLFDRNKDPFWTQIWLLGWDPVQRQVHTKLFFDFMEPDQFQCAAWPELLGEVEGKWEIPHFTRIDLVGGRPCSIQALQETQAFLNEHDQGFKEAKIKLVLTTE
ncbi:hypothetical protein BJ085DRAFT_34174 [Dimargaris cristalligena]|uniref:Uncharacterized protein n=1 Tax=Dimargaris cristalligena TaxID=215637 RepID=A0A4V1J5E0_9FUNG|nr:hypothetical protein BJ085DRAFT_34174 [Dimargaris cristalligena]|eukprot:RKP38729.1 hypothetical protein BJ085DRAFT_34174 [Dimargaris cristalligena]